MRESRTPQPQPTFRWEFTYADVRYSEGPFQTRADAESRFQEWCALKGISSGAQPKITEER
jgi:hypothetical protein